MNNSFMPMQKKNKKTFSVLLVFVLVLGLMLSACAKKEKAETDNAGTGLGKKDSTSSSVSESGSSNTADTGEVNTGNETGESEKTGNSNQEDISAGQNNQESQNTGIGALFPDPSSVVLPQDHWQAESSLAGQAQATPEPTPTKKPTSTPTPTPTSEPTPTPTPTSTPAPTPTEAPKKVSYTIMCVTPDDDTLEGVEFKICNEDSCWIVKSDFFGAAVFKNYPGQYTVSVKSVPAGYTYRGGDFTLTKNKHKYEIQLDFSTSAPTTDNDDETVEETIETGSSKADDFYVYTSSGSTVSLSSFYGKPVIINCWATWCGPCVRELPHFQKLYEEYGSKVKFMMVNCESDVSYVKSFMDSYGYNFPLYFDFDYSLDIKYGTGYIPYTITIDSKGKMHKNVVGGRSEEELREMIKNII